LLSGSNPSWHIFKEHQGGSTLVDDSQGVRDWPIAVAVASVVGVADPLSGNAVGLARQARNEDVHHSAKLLSIESFKVRPNRRRIQASRFHESK
jgi:hypothetical protein